MSTCSSVMSGGGAGGVDGSSGNGGAGGGGPGGPCGACKFLRRKCANGCIFAPYFDSEQGAAHFAAVHKVFGASNVSKLLHQIRPEKRVDAVVTVCYEAQARLRDPVYGCVAHIFALQQQIMNLQSELSFMQSTLATMELPQQQQAGQFPVQPQMPVTAGAFSVSNLPSSSTILPNTVDLSALVFDNQHQQQQQLQQNQYAAGMGASSGEASGSGTDTFTGDGTDLHALARALLNRQHVRVAGTEPPQPRAHQ